ncbi:hypothetical protein LCGC14_3129550 [marine sediment metagenome]|uniref:Uncharacterized protein n=2 Tax=marine sediment metagenome TaxID=412755 RepID=A0A0F8Y761_9ZZZZ
MFTRSEAIDFAFERGLKGANFIYLRAGTVVVFYWEGNSTNLRYGSGPDAHVTEGRLAEVLKDRDDGWFVSARTEGSWYWYFGDSGDKVPHNA